MTISLLAAFLGGIISLLSPCSAMVLPTFATAAGSSGKLFKASLVFTTGLFASLLPLVLAASAIGAFLMIHRPEITLAIGLVLLVSGVIVLLGHHLPIPNVSRLIMRLHTKSLTSTTFLLGVISGLGSTTCVGPILGIILSLAAVSSTLTQSTALVLAYTLGITLPLMIISLTYDRFKTHVSFRSINRPLTFGIFKTSMNHLFTAALLFTVAYIFIKYQGSLGNTVLFTRTNLTNKMLDWQNLIINW